MSRHAAAARSCSNRASLYDEITDKIIAELEAGRVPWVPFPRTRGSGRPNQAMSRKPSRSLSASPYSMWRSARACPRRSRSRSRRSPASSSRKSRT
ncbi:MAG TPA: ArdC-like ssDNA-binding domain-containing protein [Stellaceae bacterium]|nr:ArdC-like ssDNA-binding domain-containing protein [Stellaceae bacterium]